MLSIICSAIIALVLEFVSGTELTTRLGSDDRYGMIKGVKAVEVEEEKEVEDVKAEDELVMAGGTDIDIGWEKDIYTW
mgnify:CR=1 FL=1